jgi:hypothetical protein
LKNFNDRGGADKPLANDKFNFEGEGDQGCMEDKENTKFNANGTMMMPSIGWFKATDSSDNEDLKLTWKDNLTVYWKIEDTAGGKAQGMFEGFYVDDPMNPVITGAKTLIAGTISAAALIATLV